MDFKFHFSFDEYPEMTMVIPTDAKETAPEEMCDDLINACASEDLETKYGIHDVSYATSDLFGFTTYEVEKNKVLELMGVWKRILEGYGYKCGEITHG